MDVCGRYECRAATVTTVEWVRRGVFQLEVCVLLDKTCSKLPPNEVDRYILFATMIRFLRSKSFAEARYLLVSETIPYPGIALSQV